MEQFKDFEVNRSIEKLSTKVVHDGNKLLVSTLLKNLGNLHIRKEEFTGSIEITDESGNVVGNKEISPHIVLPGTGYELNELWTIPDRVRGDGGTLTVSVTVSVKTPYGETVKAEKTTGVEL